MTKAINSLNLYGNTRTLTLPYGVCSTAANTAAKTVTFSNFILETGARITVKFTYANSTERPTLNVNNTGETLIYLRNDILTTDQYWMAGATIDFVYNGTQWEVIGIVNDNTGSGGGTTYTHPTYTARTGKPTGNQTPAFGGTATVSQITSDGTGHVTAATDRTITIPSTLSNGTGTAGLIKTSSTVTSNSGYTASPVISGVPYYKDTTYTHPTTSGNKHIPSGGSSGQFLKWSADGTAVWAADNNTTYTFATGDSNGQIKVTPSGGSATNISVKGLGSAAYTASTAYATAAQGTLATNAMPKAGGTFTGAVSGTNISLSGFLNAGGKTSKTDGKTGIIVGSTGNMFLQGSEPTISLYNGTSTAATASISTTQGDRFGLRFIMASNGAGVGLYDSASDVPCYFRPLTNAKAGLGSESYRWYRLWASNSCNTSSDEREKSDIMSIADYPTTWSRDGGGNVFEKLFNKLVPKTYTLNVEPTDEIHIGFIAQDVAAAFEELGLSEDDLGFISHDYWTDEETGEEKDRYGLAYEEFIALNTYMIQKQRDKIETLEERIAQLEELVKTA